MEYHLSMVGISSFVYNVSGISVMSGTPGISVMSGTSCVSLLSGTSSD